MKRRAVKAAVGIASVLVLTAAGLTSDSADARKGIRCYSQLETHTGTGRGDVIFGTTSNDVMRGRLGDDGLFGLGDKDRLCGGPGDDTLIGGDGFDRINGGPGTDKCEGEVERRCEG